MLFEYSCPQHLLGGHAIATLGWIDSALAAPTEIFMNRRDRFGELVQQIAHRREFGRVYMVDGGWRQGQLIE